MNTNTSDTANRPNSERDNLSAGSCIELELAALADVLESEAEGLLSQAADNRELAAAVNLSERQAMLSSDTLAAVKADAYGYGQEAAEQDYRHSPEMYREKVRPHKNFSVNFVHLRNGDTLLNAVIEAASEAFLDGYHKELASLVENAEIGG